MKAPIVALAATAAGFAAASAYLYGELTVERVRTQAEVQARSKHEAHSRPLHNTIEFAAGGQAQASVLPFSAPTAYSEPAQMTTLITSVKVGTGEPVSAPSEVDSREERSVASRLARRLMRERASLPEPANH
jgi:hypothetical protein